MATTDEKAKALDDAKAEAEEKHLDETVEGGRYKVGNEIVDANGEPLGKKK